MTRLTPETKSFQRKVFTNTTGFRTGSSGVTTKVAYPVTVPLADTVTYGVDTIGWQENINRGFSATTSLDGVKQQLRMKEGFSSGVAKPSGPNFHLISSVRWSLSGNNVNFFNAPGAPLSGANPKAEQQAASNFLKSYLRETTTWRGGNTIAEFAETVRMLGSPVRSLFQFTYSWVGRVGKLRKVYKRDPVHYGKALGDLWLGYYLGIRPLVSDINDAQAAIRALSEDLNAVDTKRVIGFGENRTLELEQLNIGSPQFDGCVYDRRQYLIEEVKYLGAFRCRPPGVASIAENFGVGFADIAPAIWEGIPWSFIVDYFVNIGEALDSYRLVWADWGWINRTVRNRRVSQFTGLRPNPSYLQDYDMSCSGGQGYFQTKSVTRRRSGVPFPGFQFTLPGSKVQFGNISALVAAIARSRPPKPPKVKPEVEEEFNDEW